MKEKLICLLFFFAVNLNSQWVQQVVPNDVNMVLSIDFVDQNYGAAGGWKTGFWGRAVYTTNSGANWLSSQIPDSSRSLVSLQMINNLTGYFGGAYNSIVSKDLSKTNKPVANYHSANSFRSRIGLTDGAEVYKGLFLKTTSGGENWFTYGSLPSDVDYMLGIHFLNMNTGFATVSISPTGSKCKVLKTTNGGLSWLTLVSVDSVDLHEIHTQDGTIFNIAGTKGYTLNHSRGFILRSTDSGNNWNIQYINTASSIEGVDFSNASTGFACGMDTASESNGIIFKSTNSGTTWEKLTLPGNSDLFLNSIELLANSGTGLSVGTKNFYDSIVIYKTTDYGLTWNRKTMEQNGNLLISSCMIDQNNWLICGGVNSGLIYRTTNGGAIGIQQYSSEIPVGYSLSQNYPNPFNPVTNIEFKIPQRTFAELKIFDVTGKLIDILLSSELQPGTYLAKWNALNYSSGVYLYSLTAESFSQTKKMILIK